MPLIHPPGSIFGGAERGNVKTKALVMGYLRKVCERYIELKPMLYLLDALEDRRLQVG